MEKKKVDRINELGRISRTRALTPQETEEQRQLREAYIREFRALIRGEKPQKEKKEDENNENLPEKSTINTEKEEKSENA